MIYLYTTFLYDPIFNALIALYHYLPGHDLGVAIIGLTIIIKLVLFWPSLAGLKAQKRLQDTQPKIDELRQQYKDNKEELGRQLMAFYKENKVNPFSSCLPLIIQLPILIALYQTFLHGLQVDGATGLLAADQVQHLYQGLRTIYAITPIDTSLFGWVNLATAHNIVLAVLAGAASFFQAKTLQAKRVTVRSVGSKDENVAAALNKQMLYILPVMTVIFGYQFPAGVTLYWLISTLFSLVQQLYFFRVRRALSSNDHAPNQPTA
ncbi:MAG: membrane protein insertase YidC [Candidatus Kerfeldbacteria bacterium]|nr:membrane protein insertase YidC [Candidatus Kerfeldbacteria bacterium]